MNFKFTVADLKMLAACTRSANAAERRSFPRSLRKKQPEFWEAIDEVKLDPRCRHLSYFDPADKPSFVLPICEMARWSHPFVNANSSRDELAR